MEVIYLQSMTDFCLEILDENPPYNEVLMLIKISNYATFLKQPLQLGFFVPCDENGNVLNLSDAFKSCEKGFLYGKAKERVLFKGFEWNYVDECLTYGTDDSGIWFFGLEDFENETIETFGGIENKIELTETAIKQI